MVADKTHEACGMTVLIIDVGKDSLQGLEDFLDFLGFFSAALLKAEFEDVCTRPKHAEGGIFTLVYGIHGADGIIGLFYLALLTKFDYFLDGHMVSMESKRKKRDFAFLILHLCP